MDNRAYQFAKLLVEVGVNLQQGQTLVIGAPVECADFARACVEAAYAAGAQEVYVDWADDFITRQRYLYAADDTFDIFPEWDKLKTDELTKRGAATLRIAASDPENLKDVPPDRIRRARIAGGKALEWARQQSMNNVNAWCIASVPSVKWAQKVFPGATERAAMDKLWEAIYQTVRIDGGGDPVAAWHGHIDALKRRIAALDAHAFKYLKYKNSLGTDLLVELPEGHIWSGAQEVTRAGIPFVPNMPTEEIFTSPKRNGVNGVVCASMPLVLAGNIVRGLRFVIEGGKIVEATADEGEQVLRDAISVDEGASYLGEVALVAKDSPIRQSGVFFYNTLFDENAACHFAFGAAYPCLKDAETLTKEQLLERGINDSLTHIDFMVGTDDLSIIGIAHDGTEVPVFLDGNFAL